MAYMNLDVFLGLIQNDVTDLYLCTQEPTNYTEATSTFAVGHKVFPDIGAPAARSPNGRRVTVAAITNGNIIATGTATHWALISSSNILGDPTLYAANVISAGQLVTDGNTFTLTAFDVGLSAAA